MGINIKNPIKIGLRSGKMKVFSYKKYCKWVDSLNLIDEIKQVKKNSWAKFIDGEPIHEIKTNVTDDKYEISFVCKNSEGKDFTIDEKWIEDKKGRLEW